MSSRENDVVLNILRSSTKVKLLPFRVVNDKFHKNYSKPRVVIAWISVFLHFINALFFVLKARTQLLSNQTSGALLSAFLSVSSVTSLLLIWSLENAVPECIQLANELEIFDSKFIKIRTRDVKFSKWGERLVTLFVYSSHVGSIGVGLQCIAFSMDFWNETLLTVIYGLVMLIIFGMVGSHGVAQVLMFTSSIQTVIFWLKTAW